MRKHRSFLVALAGLLIVGAVWAGSVVAQEPTTPTAQADESEVVPPGAGPMGRRFGPGMGPGRHLGEAGGMIDAVAEVTGLTADEVREALADGQSLSAVIAANDATVEEAVDTFIANRIAALQGARGQLIERVQEGFPGLVGLGPRFDDATLLDVIADLTGESVADVRAALAEGTSVTDIIAGGDTTAEAVVEEFLARREATLDKLVADGRLTEEQAATMLERMEQEVREHIEEGLVGGPRGFGRGVGPGGVPETQGDTQGAGYQRGLRFSGTEI